METTSTGIWIPTEIWQNENLTVTEKLFIVKIDSLDGEKGCYASNRYFSEFFNLSKSRCSAVIKSLKDKGYIVIKYAYEEGKNAIERRIIKVKKAVSNIMKISKKSGKTKEYPNNGSEEIKNKIESLELSGAKRNINGQENLVNTDEIEETNELSIENLEEDVVKSDIKDVRNEVEVEAEGFQLDIFEEEIKAPNNSFNNESKTNENVEVINVSNKSSKSNKGIYEEIINYLNLKCNKNFKYTTGKTMKCINARIREGNTLDDFKKVIDKKYFNRNFWSSGKSRLRGTI